MSVEWLARVWACSESLSRTLGAYVLLALLPLHLAFRLSPHPTIDYYCYTIPTAEDSTKKRGAPSWAKGRTQELLETFFPDYLVNTNPEVRGNLFDTVTNLYFQNFGYEQPYNQAPPQEKELDIVSRANPEENLTQEEADRRSQLWRDLRKVGVPSIFFIPALVRRRRFLYASLRLIMSMLPLRVLVSSSLPSS